MRDWKRASPAESPLLFEMDPEPIDECLAALGGVPLLIQAVRSLRVPGSVKRNVALKQRQRGLDEASYVESFVILSAVGGDCLEDFERLLTDPRLLIPGCYRYWSGGVPPRSRAHRCRPATMPCIGLRSAPKAHANTLRATPRTYLRPGLTCTDGLRLTPPRASRYDWITNASPA